MKKQILIAILFIFLIIILPSCFSNQDENITFNFFKKTKVQRISTEEKNLALTLLRNSRKIDKEILNKMEKAEPDEKVSVIINLKDDLKLNRKNLREVKEKVRKNQKKLLKYLSLSDFQLKYKYKTINAVAGKVNIRALKLLESLPFVESVSYDKKFKPLLSESVPLIEADYVHDSLNYTGEGIVVCVLDTGMNYTHPALGGVDCHLNITEEILDEPVESNEGVHPYPDGYEETINITMPGYSSIAVHFERIGLEKGGYDYIEILDANNNVYQTIKSDEIWNGADKCDDDIYDVWSVSVPGDTIKIHLYADSYPDNPASCYGFKIDKIKVRNSSWQNCKNFLGGYNFIDNDLDPMDESEHGTHVVGIITSDDSTYRGVAPDADILMMRVCEGYSCPNSEIVAGIDWCIDNKDKYNISIMSMSLGNLEGGIYSSPCDSEVVAKAANRANNSGIFVVAASGNDGSTTGISSPACGSGVVSVGATKKDDSFAPLTNRYSNLLDLLAPGVDIYSTTISGGFLSASGTSYAAPHVAGLAALMLEANPNLSPDEIREIMKQTGVMIYDSKTNTYYPRINASAAVKAVMPEEEIISITLIEYDSGIQFGSLNPGTNDNEASNNRDYMVHIDDVTTTEVDLYQKGTNFSLDSNEISIENMKWYDSNDKDSAFIMKEHYDKKIENINPGFDVAMFYWLSIPPGQKAGTYSSNITIKAVKSGTAP